MHAMSKDDGQVTQMVQTLGKPLSAGMIDRGGQGGMVCVPARDAAK
jgi:hypothetical protein